MKLRDISDVVMGQSPPGEAVHTDAVGLPLLNGPTEFGGHHPLPVQFTNEGRKLAKAGDLLFCVRGSTTGRMNWADQTYAIGRGVAAVRHKEDVRCQPFVRATIEAALPQLLAAATGSTFPNVSRDQLLDIEVPPMGLGEQLGISEVLASLDDKIELNRRMNETLEAMARALFRSWFVDFDPVRAKAEGRPAGLPTDLDTLFPNEFEDSPLGEIPKGWRVAPVGQLCDVNSTSLSAKESLDDLEYIEISAVSRGDILETTWYERSQAPGRARRRLRHGDTVLSTVRPDRGAFFLAHEPHEKLIASTGFAVFRPSSVPWSYVHCALTLDEVSDYLGRQADGGAYPAVSPEVIGRWEVVVPEDIRILDGFHEAASAMFDLAAKNRSESKQLSLTRDELLPKLLRGDIEVAEAEVAIA